MHVCHSLSRAGNGSNRSEKTRGGHVLLPHPCFQAGRSQVCPVSTWALIDDAVGRGELQMSVDFRAWAVYLTASAYL